MRLFFTSQSRLYQIQIKQRFLISVYCLSHCILQLVVFTLCWGRHLHYRHCGALVVTHTGVPRWSMSKRQMSCQLKALKAGSPHGQTGGPPKSIAGRLCAAWLEFARKFAGMEKSWKHCWKVWHFSFAPSLLMWWQLLLICCIEQDVQFALMFRISCRWFCQLLERNHLGGPLWTQVKAIQLSGDLTSVGTFLFAFEEWTIKDKCKDVTVSLEHLRVMNEIVGFEGHVCSVWLLHM